MDENLPSFPVYPQGIPVADPRYHKPLFKMVKMLALKPKQIIKIKPRSRPRLKRKPKFY